MNLRVRADLFPTPPGISIPGWGWESPAIFLQEILMKRKYEKRDVYAKKSRNGSWTR